MDLPQALATGIKAARAAAGVAQQDLADMLGVDRQVVKRIEAGSTPVTADQWFKIAVVLDTSPTTLLYPDAKAEPITFYEASDVRHESTADLQTFSGWCLGWDPLPGQEMYRYLERCRHITTEVGHEDPMQKLLDLQDWVDQIHSQLIDRGYLQ